MTPDGFAGGESFPNSPFAADVLDGLAARPKRISPKYFYDLAGSQLFDAICELPEYYVTRTELAIMHAHALEMASACAAPVRVLEPGAGSGTKTRLLLHALGPSRCAEYVPVDIAGDHLQAAAAALRTEIPWLRVGPVCADFTSPSFVRSFSADAASTLVYFPGSTIGNFDPPDAMHLLARLGRLAGHDGAVLLGVDLKKDPALLHAAYNDASGVTAAFNKNLLVRIRRELGADVDPDAFYHHAFYDPTHGRIEMHLVSRVRQTVHIRSRRFEFAEGESIRTERSYKYDLQGAERLARGAGLVIGDAWLDGERRFAVLLLRPTL